MNSTRPIYNTGEGAILLGWRIPRFSFTADRRLLGARENGSEGTTHSSGGSRENRVDDST